MADRVWSEKELIRRANRRLAVLQHAEEVSGNVAATCRYYGISRNVFYRWKRRYEDEGLEGLKDRSSAPLYCPTVTHPDVVEKIIHLSQHYHFGPMKIRMYLMRYHDVEISASGVWRILKRLGMNRLTCLAALQASHRTVEALRETASRPLRANRRQVHRTHHHRGRPPQALLPIHRNRRLHPATRFAGLSPL